MKSNSTDTVRLDRIPWVGDTREREEREARMLLMK
jgi:hypothetical protein